MTLFIIKTFDLAAEFTTAKEQVEHLIVPIESYDFVKSYWYKKIMSPIVALPKIDLHDGYRMFVIYPMNSLSAVGYLICSNTNIELLVIGSNNQGLGLGSMLLDKCIRETIHGRVELEVHVNNTGAIKLYRRYGFKFSDCHGPYIVMRLNKLVAASL